MTALSKQEEEKNEFSGFKYYSEERKRSINIPSNLKHILIFGQSRQGKSSIVNLMTNNDKKTGAYVSDAVKGCSFSTEPWFNDEYCFWDTAGLNEQDNGSIINSVATKNLIKFVKDSKGFHGAIMVVSWNNINTSTTKRNWDLFYDTFLDQRIPIIICITGRGIESSSNDQTWLDEQNAYIKSLGYISKIGKPQKCVVYSKDISEISSDLQNYYFTLKTKSKTYIAGLLKANVTNQFYNPISEEKWVDVFKKMYNTIAKFLGFKTLMISVREGFQDLLIKLGFTNDEAHEIASEIY